MAEMFFPNNAAVCSKFQYWLQLIIRGEIFAVKDDILFSVIPQTFPNVFILWRKRNGPKIHSKASRASRDSNFQLESNFKSYANETSSFYLFSLITASADMFRPEILPF